MPGITLQGINGLNTASLIQGLMQAERQPLSRLEAKESSYKAEISSLGKLKSAVAKLDDALTGLKSGTSFNATRITDPEDKSFAVSGSYGVASGNYSVEVLKTAKGASVQSANYASRTSSVGEGTLTVETGSYASGSFVAGKSVAIQVDATDTLEQIRDKVNATDSGVKASVVTDVKGSRLVFASNETGETAGIRIQANDTDGNSQDTSGLSNLNYNQVGSSNALENRREANAQIKVDGSVIENTTNEFSNAVDGLTIVANKVSSGEQVIQATKGAGVSEEIKKVVEAYNEARALVKSLSGKDGALSGSSLARNLDYGLTSALRSVSADGIGGLHEVGLSSDRYGVLQFDEAKFSAGIASGKQFNEFVGNLAGALDAVADRTIDAGGSLTNRVSVLNQAISDIGKQKDTVEARLTRVQASYEQRFANLQTLLTAQQANGGKLSIFA